MKAPVVAMSGTLLPGVSEMVFSQYKIPLDDIRVTHIERVCIDNPNVQFHVHLIPDSLTFVELIHILDFVVDELCTNSLPESCLKFLIFIESESDQRKTMLYFREKLSDFFFTSPSAVGSSLQDMWRVCCYDSTMSTALQQSTAARFLSAGGSCNVLVATTAFERGMTPERLDYVIILKWRGDLTSALQQCYRLRRCGTVGLGIFLLTIGKSFGKHFTKVIPQYFMDMSIIINVPG